MEQGFPHDYGQRCCCPTCTGPDGSDCSPDTWTGDCVRCGRAAILDDRETTADLFEAIAVRINGTARGQVSWLD